MVIAAGLVAVLLKLLVNKRASQVKVKRRRVMMVAAIF